MFSLAHLRQILREVKLSQKQLSAEERLFCLEWERNHLENFGGPVVSFGAVVIGLSLIPVYFFAPEPHRLVEFSTHLICFILFVITRIFAFGGHRDPRPFFLSMQVTMAAGYAACAKICFAVSPSLNDVAFLPTMSATTIFFCILLFPYGQRWFWVVPAAAFYWGLGVWGIAGYQPLILQHWGGILAVGCGFSVAVFTARVHYARGEALSEYKARILLVQNDRLRLDAINKELEIAREIQDSLQPPSSLMSAGDWRLVFYQIKFSALGGDWMAARQLASGDIILVVADATGKGIQAALIVHAVQSLWANALAAADFEPLTWLQSVNRTLFEMGRRKEHTMSLGLMVLRPTSMTYYSAGHVPIFLVGNPASDYQLTPVVGRGSLLGLTAELELEPRHTELAAGSVVESMLFGTDGVFDRGVRTRKKVLTMLLADVELHGTPALRNCPAMDDKLLIWIRRASPAAEQRLEPVAEVLSEGARRSAAGEVSAASKAG